MRQGDSVGGGKPPFQKKGSNLEPVVKSRFWVFLNRYNRNTITNIQLWRNIQAHTRPHTEGTEATGQ